MADKKFFYLLGIIKWINLFTFSVVLANLFSVMGMPSQISAIFILVLVSIITLNLNKWFEKKFGSENIIENTLAFKLAILMMIIGSTAYLVILKQYTTLILIFGFMIFFSFIVFLFSKIKKKKGAVR